MLMTIITLLIKGVSQLIVKCNNYTKRRILESACIQHYKNFNMSEEMFKLDPIMKSLVIRTLPEKERSPVTQEDRSRRSVFCLSSYFNFVFSLGFPNFLLTSLFNHKYCCFKLASPHSNLLFNPFLMPIKCLILLFIHLGSLLLDLNHFFGIKGF